MKVAYVTVSMPFGQFESFFIPEANELTGQGVELYIFPRHGRSRCLNKNALSLVRSTLSYRWWHPAQLFAVVAAAMRDPATLMDCLKHLLVGTSLCNGMKNLAVLPRALWLAQYARREKFDHIHSCWAATTATIAYVTSRLSGIPWSFTAHRGDIAADNCLDVKVASATFVRCISEKSREMLLQRLQWAHGRVEVLHMGVDCKNRDLPGRAADPAELFCPASLIPVKGHRHLIEAVRLLEGRGVRVRLTLAGTGELARTLQGTVHELGLEDRVGFLGHLPHDTVMARYRSGGAGMVVLPSVDLGNGCHEGIPVALMEAMSFAIPVVSTASGGIPELLGGGAGIIVPPGDPKALADAIERLIGDGELRAAIAGEGLSRVREGFSISANISRLKVLMGECSALME